MNVIEFFTNPHILFFIAMSAVKIALLVVVVIMFFRQKEISSPMLWFSLFLVESSLWSLVQIPLAASTGAQFAFWNSIQEVFVSFAMPLVLCLVLVFVGKEKVLRNIASILFIFFPAIILLFLYWKTDAVIIHDFTRAIQTPWGYEYLRQEIPWDNIILTFYCVYSLIELGIYYLRENDAIRKRHVLLLFIAILIPMAIDILFKGILPLIFVIPEFPISSIGLLAMCLVFGVTLIRYEKEFFSTAEASSDVFQIFPGSLIILDAHYLIRMVNMQLLDALHMQKEALIGKPFATIVKDSQVQERWQKDVFDRLIAGNEITNVEESLVASDGTSMLVSVRANIKRTDEGKIRMIMLFISDLSEAKKKEQEMIRAIEQSEKQNILLQDNKSAMLNLLEDARMLEEDLKRERDRANAIVSSMSEGLFVVDSKGQIVLINPMAKKLLGLESDKVIGRPLTDVVMMRKGKKDVASSDRPLHHVLATGVPVTYGLEDDYYLRSIDGQMIPVSLSIAPLRHGEEIVGALETFHDTTRDKQVKETIEQTVEERTLQLKEEQARLTASINSLEMGFILTDIDGGIISKNPAASSLLNLPWGTKNFADMEEALKGSSSLVELHNKARNEHKPVDKRNVSYGGKFIDIFIAPIYIGGRDEDFIGSVLLIQDQTEAKVLERSRDEFFSIASHELRTPLTAIRGNTSLIQEHYSDKLDPELKEMIGDVHDSSIRLIDIVNDFLNMGRLEQQRFTFKNEPFKMEDLITSALKEYEVTGSRQQLGLEFVQPATPIHPAFADRERVRQVLVNLIGNSLKFTEKGGVKVFVREDSGMVEVSITDTGHGIPLQNQALLFHKFQQAGDSLFTRDTTKGTGLGLYISKLMIEAMGGKIWLVKSEEGVGSTFAFSLPLASTGAL